MANSVETVVDLDSWHQMSGEGDIGYGIFKAYVATGLASEDGLKRKRDLEKVIRTSNVPEAVIRRLHTDYFWHQRAQAYDLYIAQVKEVSLARRTNLYHEARTDLAAVCAIEANRMLTSAKAGESIFKGTELVRALEALVKLERLEAGQSTENVAVAAYDMSKLDDAEAEAMHALLLKSTKS